MTPWPKLTISTSRVGATFRMTVGRRTWTRRCRCSSMQIYALDATHASAYAGLGEAFWRRCQFDPRHADGQRLPVRPVNVLRGSTKNNRPPTTAWARSPPASGATKGGRRVEHTLAHEPDSELARIGLATAYARLGQAHRAEETYLEAIRLRPRYWSGGSRLGASSAPRCVATRTRSGCFNRSCSSTPIAGGTTATSAPCTTCRVARRTRSLRINNRCRFVRTIKPHPISARLLFFDLGDYARAADAYRQAVKLDGDR